MDRPEINADILLVDDEVAIAKGMQRVLESCGARVVLAMDGCQALEKLEERDFDVMVIDLVMPSLGGMEVLERVAEEGLRVVSVVITAHVSLETAVEAMRRGAFDYLPKPFEPRELILRVERALNYRRLRDQAENSLLELNTSRTQLRTIVEAMGDGVIVVNVDGLVVLCNPAACAAVGYGPSLHEPRPLEEVIRSPELRRLIQLDVSSEDGCHAAQSGQIQLGSDIYMVQVFPIETSQAKFLGTVAVLHNVTDLLKAERAKLKFMAKVAHELKSPLAAVQGFLKVILRGPQQSPEQQRDIVLRCSERVEGMVQLVRDLLDLSRSEALPRRNIEPVPVAEVVAEVVEMNEALAADNAVRMTVEVADDLPPLYADREDLFCLLNNLVSNSIKYNLPGGAVRIEARREGEGVQFVVADTGLGIPPEAIPRLGEEFFRVQSPERRGIVGTGLGLSIVKRTVAAYHGRLSVESTPGQGSVFSVWLPSEFQGEGAGGA